MFTILLLTICVAVATAQPDPTIEGYGNEIVPSARGDLNLGSIVLLKSFNLSDGVLFAYRAYVTSTVPIRIQVYRPLPIPANQTGIEIYQMIGETRFLPTRIDPGQEDVYISSGLGSKCIRVKSGDHLALYHEEVPGSIAATFVTDPKTVLEYGGPMEIDGNLTVTLLRYPYDYSVKAYVHTNLSAYPADDGQNMVDCIPNLRIPEVEEVVVSTTTTPIPTGRPGDTGATGPQGDTGSVGPMGEVGDTGVEGPVGPIGMNGSTGEQGPIGDIGPMGMTGNQGDTGATGERGDTGLTGPEGPEGQPGLNLTEIRYEPAPPAALVGEENVFSNPWITLALLIWLFIVSLIVIIILVKICCCSGNREEEEDNNKRMVGYNNNAYERKYKYNEDLEANIANKGVGDDDAAAAGLHRPLSSSSSVGAQPGWMGTMRSTDESLYSNNTIEEEEQAAAPGKSPNGKLESSDTRGEESNSTTMPPRSNSYDSLAEEKRAAASTAAGDGDKTPAEGRTEF